MLPYFRNQPLSLFSSPTRDLRALWRIPLYIALLVVLFTIFNMVLERFPALGHSPNSPSTLFAQESAGFAIVALASWILSRIEGCPLGNYGLRLTANFAQEFFQGCIFGLCEISLLIGVIAAFGGYSFGALSLGGSAILRWAVTWAVVFLFVGFFEEFGFRGYILHGLAQLIGFWPAAISLGLVFGYVHSYNPGETWPGELGVFCIAVIFAFTLRRTGSLWLAVGWHAAFDFGESFLYSVPDSGAVIPGHLSTAYLHGPTWKTGGSDGPEASLFSFAVMALMTAIFHFLYPAKPTPAPRSPTLPTPALEIQLDALAALQNHAPSPDDPTSPSNSQNSS